jgi:hypothetical protein
MNFDLGHFRFLYALNINFSWLKQGAVDVWNVEVVSRVPTH